MFSVHIKHDSFQPAADALVSRTLDGVFSAADAAGKVIQDAYQAAVPEHNPPGTFKNAAGIRQHFMQLKYAIGRRTLQFQDRTGAYSVVGVKAAPNNWRSLAPQGLWIEEGTDDRETKDGRPTGFTPAYHILAQISEKFAIPATNTFNAVLKQVMDR